MSCHECRHWWWPDQWMECEFVGVKRPPEAWCTLNPNWLKTKEDHFCGQQLSGWGERKIAQAEKENNYRLSLNRREHVTDQRARAIKAEKALKEARAEIRRLGGR